MIGGIDPNQLRDLLIRPTLIFLGLGGDAAEELLLGTTIQESGCGEKLMQVGGGPALGLWQIEPATHDDVWKNFFLYRSDLSGKVAALRFPMFTIEQQLECNLMYQCAIARIIYYRAKEPLPAAGDLAGQAAYYKLHFNGPGAATAEEYIANWRARFPHPVEPAKEEA